MINWKSFNEDILHDAESTIGHLEKPLETLRKKLKLDNLSFVLTFDAFCY